MKEVAIKLFIAKNDEERDYKKYVFRDELVNFLKIKENLKESKLNNYPRLHSCELH